MAFQTRSQKAAVKAAVDTFVGRLDLQTGATAAKVKIISGTQADSPDDATFTGTTLATITLAATAFGNATTGTAGEAAYIISSAASLPKTDSSAAATGTAGWFRAVDKGGNAIIDGDVGTTTTTADMALNNTSITAGQEVSLTAWKIRQQFK